jgi:hypothetical protein
MAKNIFEEPKQLKKWAIDLANACGGQEVTQTSIKLNKHSVQKVDKLLEQFAVDYNFHMQMMNEVREKQDAEQESFSKEVKDMMEQVDRQKHDKQIQDMNAVEGIIEEE